MNEIGITADTHLGHYNIILHTNRVPWLFSNPNFDPSRELDFKHNYPLLVDLDKHDNDLIDNINSKYDRKDTLYMVGDFAWKNHARYVNMIKPKIVFIAGNHDAMNQETIRLFSEYHEMGCRKKICVFQPDIKKPGRKEDITFSHYAMRSWASSCHGSICLYGHSHGRMPEFDNMLSFDIGVDVWDYSVIPLEVVMKKVNILRELSKFQMVDGESAAKGIYNKDPEQRVIDLRRRNFEILESTGIAIKYPIFETKQETIDRVRSIMGK